jgi:hypothetical protein
LNGDDGQRDSWAWGLEEFDNDPEIGEIQLAPQKLGKCQKSFKITHP